MSRCVMPLQIVDIHPHMESMTIKLFAQLSFINSCQSWTLCWRGINSNKFSHWWLLTLPLFSIFQVSTWPLEEACFDRSLSLWYIERYVIELEVNITWNISLRTSVRKNQQNHNHIKFYPLHKCILNNIRITMYMTLYVLHCQNIVKVVWRSRMSNGACSCILMLFSAIKNALRAVLLYHGECTVERRILRWRIYIYIYRLHDVSRRVVQLSVIGDSRDSEILIKCTAVDVMFYDMYSALDLYGAGG